EVGARERVAILPRHVEPVLEEDELGDADDSARQAHVQIAVRTRLETLVLLVGDVDPARVSDLSVDDRDLPVHPVVPPGAREVPELGRVEPHHLAAGLDERAEEFAAELRAAYGVEEEAHLHSGPRAL